MQRPHALHVVQPKRKSTQQTTGNCTSSLAKTSKGVIAPSALSGMNHPLGHEGFPASNPSI
jgi:hypothetical protein